jgi:hypothetical protein
LRNPRWRVAGPSPPSSEFQAFVDLQNYFTIVHGHLRQFLHNAQNRFCSSTAFRSAWSGMQRDFAPMRKHGRSLAEERIDGLHREGSHLWEAFLEGQVGGSQASCLAIDDLFFERLRFRKHDGFNAEHIVAESHVA